MLTIAKTRFLALRCFSGRCVARGSFELRLCTQRQRGIEQVFFNQPLLIVVDAKHSQREPRLHALGKTDDERALHITLTLRQSSSLIRVISARDMHRKERALYEQAD